jgi:hypothetical protein
MVLSNDNVTEGAMPKEKAMTIGERRKYLSVMRGRYLATSKKGRGILLTEMGKVTGLHRKSLVRLMKSESSLKRRPRRKERGRKYGPEVDEAIWIIAESLDHICAERVTPNLVWMAKHLEQHGELRLTPELLTKLEEISVPTVRRSLQHHSQDERRLPRRGPKRVSQTARAIPMERIAWDEQVPGHFEVDSVHHGGSMPTGDYVHTLQFIDVATGWSERVAVLGRSQLVVEDGFRVVLQRLPFPVLEVHSDNGPEVLNAHLVRFWGERVTGMHLSRSRPYEKNDNRFVEQKNATLVRQYLGDLRLDTVAQTHALNELYDIMWLFYNLFQPVMRQIAKDYISTDGQPTRVVRRFDTPRTPFDRVCQTGVIPPERQEMLRELRAQTNPRRLRQDIYDRLDDLARMPGAPPGVIEDVMLSLRLPTKLHRS